MPDAALPVLSLLPGDLPPLVWEPFREGIAVSWIYRTGAGGPAAAFLRYDPGAAAPHHVHDGYEHILVLEGSQEDARGRYPAGSFVVNPPGTGHTVSSPEGCLVLIVWERPVRFV
ncbi:cupin domain-containing protein [Azospirillum halopraeferens]|uniref:cupin domain-containing protein n=1 Tax=Azospirillum halopraeferens TaxID=34010 RepID=UPI0003FBC845|nr:cupin domain-containing protein [Azospirillum halopraeferens]